MVSQESVPDKDKPRKPVPRPSEVPEDRAVTHVVEKMYKKDKRK